MVKLVRVETAKINLKQREEVRGLLNRNIEFLYAAGIVKDYEWDHVIEYVNKFLAAFLSDFGDITYDTIYENGQMKIQKIYVIKKFKKFSESYVSRYDVTVNGIVRGVHEFLEKSVYEEDIMDEIAYHTDLVLDTIAHKSGYMEKRMLTDLTKDLIHEKLKFMENRCEIIVEAKLKKKNIPMRSFDMLGLFLGSKFRLGDLVEVEINFAEKENG